MTIIKNILARLFAAWALLTFVLSFLIIYLPSMICWLIPDPRGQHVFIYIARIWMSFWLPISGCRFRVRGKENFKKGQTFIVTCNHNSLMDVPLSPPFIPGPNKTIAKTGFARIPLFGFFYMKGSVLVDRKNEINRRKSFDKMKQVLQKGIHMCIFPEGTRNRTGDPLKKFHDGAFRLATGTGKGIIPAVILHTKKVLPPAKFFYFWPSRIEIHFLEPVFPEGLNMEQLKEKVFGTMKDYYISHNT